MSDDFTRARMMWLDQIFDDSDLTSTVRDVAFRISRYFNRKGFADSGNLNAWPSYQTLANEAGCTAKTVQRAINLLKDRGHVITKGNGGRSVTLTYFAVINSKPQIADCDEDAQPEIGGKGGHPCPRIGEKVDIGCSKGGHLDAEKVDTHVLQTSLNKSLNKSLSETRANDPAFEPFKAAWSLAVFDGLSRGPSQLPRPATALMRKLIEIEQRPAMILEHQAKHGWPDINRMFDQPTALDASTLAPSIRKMAFEMEPVASGSAQWEEWQSEFEARGWPFPKEAKGMSFPRGGPRMLGSFMTVLAARQADGSANVVAMTKAAG